MVLQISDPAYAGSYNLVLGESSDYYAGRNTWYWTPDVEARNWFAFEIPFFDAPLVGAELRVYAGLVWVTNGTTILYELHQVTTPFEDISNHTGNRTNTFTDLGDGPVFGSRTFSNNDTWSHRGISALFGIRVNAAALAEITAKQAGWFCVGGRAIPNNGLVFDSGTLEPKYPIQLVLYFSNAAPPQVSTIAYDPPLDRLTGERINLSSMVCGQEPLRRQWMKDGEPIPNATNEVLDLHPLTGSDTGSYWLEASNEVGTNRSDIVTLVVNPAQILQQPRSATVAEGQSLTLAVAATGHLPLHYQWRKDGTNLVGADRNTFTISPARLADAGTYDVVIYDSLGTMVSDAAQVTVNLSPPVNNDLEPRDLEIAVGLPLNLIYYFSGGTPSQYQWFRDGQPLPGATAQQLSIPSLGFNDGGAYWLVAANAAGSATSAVTHVIVQPLIIYNVGNATVLWQNAFALVLEVQSSAPVSYQWYFDDAPISGGTNHVLSFSAVDFSDAGPYFLVASNSYGVVTSAVVSLTVETQAPTVIIYPQTILAWVGEDAVFSGDAPAGPPAMMQWFRNDTPLSGQTGPLLRLTSVTTNDSGEYVLRAGNIYGADSASATLTVIEEAPFFINLPTKTNAVAGELVVLRTKAVGGPPPTYQWRKDGVDLAGETNSTLSLGWVDLADSGLYELVARNRVGETRYTHPFRVTPATGLDRWQWRFPKPQGSRLYAIAYNNGRYVATGKAGNIITSTDGQHWVSSTVAQDADLRVLAAGNGIFVTAGRFNDFLTYANQNRLSGHQQQQSYNLLYNAGVMLVSSNGTDWLVGKGLDNDWLQDIAFGNGIFVAVGTYDGPFCYVSTDGLSWNGVEAGDNRAYQVKFGNGRFLGQASGMIFYSTDGYHWTPTSAAPGNLLAFGNGRFFASDGISVYESVDGMAWTHVGAAVYAPYWGFTGGAGKFVAKLYIPFGQVGVSTDGATWLPVDTGTRQEIEGVAYVNGEFLAVGEAGTITRSSNGLNWTPDEVANKVDFYGITHGEGLHVVAGDAGTILISSNAVDWTRAVTPFSRNLHAVAYGGDKFVAGGRGGALMSSDDGITWMERNSHTDKYVERIAWANGLWVAVTEQGDITTSPNGVDWTATSTGYPITDHEGVTYGNGLWMVVGGYFQPNAISTFYTSTDAANWARVGPNLGKRLRDVTYARGLFVAVGNDGLVAYSTNGLLWSSGYQANQNLRRVHYANGRFVAVGNDGTLISTPNPRTGSWTKHRVYNSQNLHDIIAAPDGTFLFVGNNGMLLRSGKTGPRFLSLRRDGRLEFDADFTSNLRLEGSTDLETWETDVYNVTSPYTVPIGSGSKFWRLVGE